MASMLRSLVNLLCMVSNFVRCSFFFSVIFLTSSCLCVKCSCFSSFLKSITLISYQTYCSNKIGILLSVFEFSPTSFKCSDQVSVHFYDCFLQ